MARQPCATRSAWDVPRGQRIPSLALRRVTAGVASRGPLRLRSLRERSGNGEWTLRCDGGSRGNPGPAALGYVLLDPSGREARARGEYIGPATNNVAEYRALIAGLRAAVEAGAARSRVMDSELVVRQMTGEYRVKHAGLKPLHAEARLAGAALGRCATARAAGGRTRMPTGW